MTNVQQCDWWKPTLLFHHLNSSKIALRTSVPSAGWNRHYNPDSMSSHWSSAEFRYKCILNNWVQMLEQSSVKWY
jgi:hypothetical protein